ncbi:MAG: FAD:protein FMN transferase [Gemmatimonadales bacterium]
MSDAFVHTVSLMGTVVTFEVVGHGGDRQERIEREAGVERALEWFHRVSDCCSRFDERSEVRRLSAQIGVSVPVSDMLFEAVRFALAVAEESGGAFDPTVGLRMEALGFDREYRSGRVVRTALPLEPGVSYRDVRLDPELKTITLDAPLVLDLGAVAKGLAIDMAARELTPFEDFAIDAGGDLFFGGHNLEGAPWSVGIRHPRDEHELIETLNVSDVAVCTSGDYERRSPAAEAGHHILDPRSGDSAAALASVTVIAPAAMVADALSTAAFVLGPVKGLELLERHGVEGLMMTPALERFTTASYRREVLRFAQDDHAVRTT